ncbi:PQQ-binding-like beta-propeller repeat protein [Sphingobacterium sp. SRCM116780]|uniref:outer membrane protein assembly factor BamB family protein n=1 Tax=Sphingobacterium sp. SRCM116780 TaxID=2907623 RepID=UPI001F184128|nr:PQQ-binding-like beta-propeller repeat protein [Sphingobacterium sp. SRCM116780]UIR55558.1 PQQ-binding-like beta-propeller repeat protein [Sphingobacterium sp. SRCM116780]
MLKYLLISSLFVGTLQCSFAQEVVPFESKIQEVKIDPFTGNIIVKTKEGISSLNPTSKKIDWSVATATVNNATTMSKLSKGVSAIENNDFLAAFSSTSQIDLIANSPFADVKFDNNSVVVNTTDGKVVYNAAELGYNTLAVTYIPEKKQFLILGEKDKSIDFVNLDLLSGKVNWTSKVGDTESLFKSFGSAFKGFLKGDVLVADNRVIVSGNHIFAALKGILFNLDGETGNVKWKTDYLINNFYVSGKGDKIVTVTKGGGLLSSKQNLNILDVNDGNKLWKDDISTKYLSYLEDQGDKLLVAHSSGFNFFDYATGKKVWKKDAKGDEIKEVIPVGQDYLYIADIEMNLVDQQGQNKWKKFVEIAEESEDRVYYLGAVSNNRVFYLTDTYGNMVDYTTGKKIWKKNAEFDKKRPLVYAADGDRFLVYNNKRIYTFDASSMDSPMPKGKIDVENDKTIESIEAFDWGVCIVGQNDVIGLDNDGKTIYQNSYKEPGEAGRRLLKTGGIIGSSFFSVRSSLKRGVADMKFQYRDADGSTREEYVFDAQTANRIKKSAKNDDQYSDVIDKNLTAKVAKRFNGLKQNSEFAFVLAKGATSPELIKVRKKDGKEVAKIELAGNKPIYEVDPIDGSLYYAQDSELKIYSN